MRAPDRGPSLWEATAELGAYAALEGDRHVDVAIVGGGITGLTAALRLREAGLDVAVLDMRRIGSGETGQTTAHLTEIVDNGYSTVASDFGREAAALVARSSREAIEFIERTALTLAIPCSFERVPGFWYSERDDHLERLHTEVEQARLAGVDARFTTDVPLPFPTRGALQVEQQAQFHPRQYLAGIAEYLAGRGTAFYERTRAVSIEDGEPCRVETEHGVLTARAVIMATNVPLNRVALITKLPAYRSYAIGVRMRGEAPHGLFWDTDDPYHYTRTHDAHDGSIVIIGGEDHRTGTDGETPGRYEALEEYATRRFPIERVEYRWSGQILEPVDGLPYIGLNTAASHVYVATGYAGNGMTYGTLGGLITADLILGRTNPYAGLYEATRVKPLAAATDYVTENVEFPMHLVKDRLTNLGAEGDAPDAVPSGAGRILAVDGRKLAVYRADDQTLHAFSPVCPHMGCDVAWNPAEQTWDCPCHGSRFSATGEVLNGPAVTPLSRVDLRETARRR